MTHVSSVETLGFISITIPSKGDQVWSTVNLGTPSRLHMHLQLTDRPPLWQLQLQPPRLIFFVAHSAEAAPRLGWAPPPLHTHSPQG